MPVLDIVITHYNETPEIYGKLFRIIGIQRGIDFADIHLIVVNDGKENHIPDDEIRELLGNDDISFEQKSILKAGISAARNHGLRMATAEWICWCDCDDCFTTVYSLKLVLDNLKNPDISKNYDMLWTKLCAEDSDGNGGMNLISRNELNLVFIHGKFYRRQFLIDNDITYPEELEFNEDSAFNAIANTYWDYKRTGEIKANFPLYSWCYRKGSLTSTPENLDRAILGSYKRNKIVCDVIRERLPYDRYCGMVARTVFDAYYVLNVPNITPIRADMIKDFKQWYSERKEDFWACPIDEMREIKAVSRAEHKAGIAEESIRWPGNPSNPCIEEISTTKWLNALEANA